MNVHFSKYHGTGNDFILIDGRAIDTSVMDTQIIKYLCHRRFGIGADGLIILKDSKKYDFRMVYYNSDGEEGSMCGNGGRCITAFAHKLGITGTAAIFEGIDGSHEATILPNGHIKLRLIDVEGIKTFEDGYFLNTGSPHFVKIVENSDVCDVQGEGKTIRHEARFLPGGTNVNFVQLLPESMQIKVRTYERGVEKETLSCGTGVTAAAIVSYYKQKPETASYQIDALGGKLTVSFIPGDALKFTEVYLTGPATHVFDGTYSL